MAALISVAIAASGALFFGKFSELVLVAGICCLIGFFWPIFRAISVFVFFTTISVAYSIADSSSLGIFIPGMCIWILRCALRESFQWPRIWMMVLPIPILFFSFPDRDYKICSLLALASTLPIYCGALGFVPERRVTRGWLLALLAVISLGVGSPHFKPRTGSTVILDSGVWAQSSKKLGLASDWNIESMYSYSEFASLIEADVTSIDNLTSKSSEAWLITPTRPMSKAQAEILLNWVGQGGTLIVVTDHTDLFGHARVVNDALGSLGLETSYSAFFPPSQGGLSQLSPGGSLPLKTSNIQLGGWLWPRLTARWWNEAADYSNKNFFGPLRPSGDDVFGRRIVGGYRNLGKGSIVLFGDSTILSNFAVYQPGIIPTIERLRQPGIMSLLYPWVCGLFMAAVGVAMAFRRTDLLTTIPAIGLLAVLDFGRVDVKWPKFEWWSGNKQRVMEWGDPHARLSTAYSVACTSGLKPRWTDRVDSQMQGIWVSEAPPPNDQWRWIDAAKAPDNSIVYDQRWEPLLEKITPQNPSVWRLKPDWGHERVGGVWTDDVVGDWWFDRGISVSKRLRLEAWIAWLNKNEPPAHPLPVAGDGKMIDYLFKVDGATPHSLRLPAVRGKAGDQIYLGRGVSVEIVSLDGSNVLLGSKPYTETWGGPSAWVLVPLKQGAEKRR